MRSLITKVALLATSFAIPAIAHADAFTFTTPSQSIQFDLPHSPTALTPGPIAFQIDNVAYTYHTTLGVSGASTASFIFYSNGNFAYFDNALHVYPFATSTNGRALFSGTEVPPTLDPTFNYGAFDFTVDNDFGVTLGPAATLTNTPEPSSLLLMGTGFFGIFAAGRRRLSQ